LFFLSRSLIFHVLCDVKNKQVNSKQTTIWIYPWAKKRVINALW